MFAHRLTIPQIMVLLDQAVAQTLIGCAPDLSDIDVDLGKPGIYRGLIDVNRRALSWLDQRIFRRALFRRQLDMAGPLQLKQEAAANHIAQNTVWLNPVPCAANFLRQRTAAGIRIVGNQLVDRGNIFCRDTKASVFEYWLHVDRIAQWNLERNW